MKKSFVYCFLLLLPAFLVGARAQSQLSSEATISILTSSPWSEEVYALFGHTALRVKDKSQGLDLVFNYGLFSFNKPNFMYHFVKGETDYQLGATDFSGYAIEYQLNNLEVVEQVINLTDDEKNALWSALLVNFSPENREYRYNFFYDNCSTRPFYLINESIGGSLELDPLKETLTWRDLINGCTADFSWLTYSINLVVAQPADEVIDKYQILFLPYHLMKALESTTVTTPDGCGYPLLKEQAVIIASEPDNEEEAFNPASLLTPAVVTGLLLIILLLLAYSKKTGTKTFKAIAYTLFTIAGIGGCVVFFLSFFSEHPAMFPNWNLLWLQPLQLIVPAWSLVKSRSKMLYCYHFINFAMLLFFIAASPFIKQAVPLASVFLVLSLMLCSVRYLYYFKRS